MAGAPLLIYSTITVESDEGPRFIELCFGDITSTRHLRQINSIDEDAESSATSKQEPMDVIMVSAFQGK